MFISHPDHELLIGRQHLERLRSEAAEHRLASSGTTASRRPRVVAVLALVVLTTIAIIAFDWQRSTEAHAPVDDEHALLREAPPDEAERDDGEGPSCEGGGHQPATANGTVAGLEFVGPIFRPVRVRFR